MSSIAFKSKEIGEREENWTEQEMARKAKKRPQKRLTRGWKED